MPSFISRTPLLSLLSLCLLSTNVLAKTIVITGQQIIDEPTLYDSVTLDLSHGSFLIRNRAQLTIKNSQIKGVITSANPNLILVEAGELNMRDDKLVVDADVKQDPNQPSLYPCIKVLQGKVVLNRNDFTVNQPFTASLLYTDHFVTSEHVVLDNKIRNFHGGLFLSNTNHVLVARNHFSHVSLSNIFTKNSNDNIYKQNTILYSGNNGVDVIDSKNIILDSNYIGLSSCYSMYVLRSQNLLIEHNMISGGITYGIIVVPKVVASDKYAQQLLKLVNANSANDGYANKNIRVVSNYISQNRYGLATSNVNGLEVANNVFIQKFAEDSDRTFWTNNLILLRDTKNINWQQNWYKEAYPQIFAEHDKKSTRFIAFPEKGGVTYSGLQKSL